MPPVVTPMTMASGGPWETAIASRAAISARPWVRGTVPGMRDVTSPDGRGGSTDEGKRASGASPHAAVSRAAMV